MALKFYNTYYIHNDFKSIMLLYYIKHKIYLSICYILIIYYCYLHSPYWSKPYRKADFPHIVYLKSRRAK